MPTFPPDSRAPLPLAGVRVLVTRPAGAGAQEWAAALRTAGAEPVPYPTTAIVPPTSWQPLDQALARLDDYDWVVFTSQTAVDFVLRRLPARRFPHALGPRLAAVGSATARAIAAAGGGVALLPADSRQEGLVAAFAGLPAGTRVLFPAAVDARTLLPESLRARGCQVELVTTYQTLPRTDLPPVPEFDVATFASPSALRAYLSHAGAESLAGKRVAVIGATTATVAAANGIQVVVAEKTGVAAVISAIATSRRKQGEP